MKHPSFVVAACVVAAQALLPVTVECREIRIGLTGTFTGPAAAIGIPNRQAAELFPREIAGQAVKWMVLDDFAGPAAERRAHEYVAALKAGTIGQATATGTNA